jgi:branched-chain amino acid transport system substrate-binding protein
LLILCGNIALAENKVFKIGLVASLSGPAAEQGLGWLEGAQLAAAELEKEGIAVQLLIEDDQTNPTKTVSAFHRLAQNGVQAIVGGTWDFLAEASFPLAARYKIPFITPTNPIEILSIRDGTNPWAFTNGLSLKAERTVFLQFLSLTKIRSLAIVHINVPFGTSHAELIRGAANESGLFVLFESALSFENFEGTLKAAALKTKQSNPALVYLATDYQGVDLFTRELKRLQSRPFILTTQHLEAAFAFSKDPSRYTKAFAIYPHYQAEPFLSLFRLKFGHLPRVYAAAGFDAVNFLALGLGKDIFRNAAAARFTYDGITGKHLFPAAHGNLVENKAKLMTTQNGKFEDSTSD